jgi:glycosyltransferase involved in cell wall biosynthesis
MTRREAAAEPEAIRPLNLAFLGDPNSVHTRRWLSYFAARGHRVTLLLPAQIAMKPGFPESVAVERLDPATGSGLPKMGALKTRRSLIRVLARLQPDVLHAHYVTGNAWRAWLSTFHPYVVTVWGSDVLALRPRDRRRRLLARLSLRAADVVTGGSDHLVRAAVAHGARPDRMRYVHFGVDTERFSPGPDPLALRRRLGLEGRRVLLSNRLIAPIYRQGVVVRTLPDLPDDVVALMTRYGAQEPEVAAVQSLAAELGVSDRVRIVDALPESDLPDLYRLADVVVSIPASDGGPVTLVEALSSGRPVVATDLPSVREWLGELDPEALVPVDDAAATAVAVRTELARSEGERRERSDRARARVAEKADWRTNMDRMEAIYRELAARKRR